MKIISAIRTCIEIKAKEETAKIKAIYSDPPPLFLLSILPFRLIPRRSDINHCSRRLPRYNTSTLTCFPSPVSPPLTSQPFKPCSRRLPRYITSTLACLTPPPPLSPSPARHSTLAVKGFPATTLQF